MRPSMITVLLVAIIGAVIIAVVVLTRPQATPSSTATPFVQAQAPAAQLIQCADGVIRATCPPVAQNNPPAAAAQPQPTAVSTTVPPSNTPIPAPTATSPPEPSKPTEPPTFPPAQQAAQEREIDCTYPTACSIPTPGQNQAVLVHGAISGTDPQNCHYQIFASGQAVRVSYNGTYRSFIITGTQDQINAKIREHLNGLGSSCSPA